MITCGCDVGSRACKVVILDGDKIIGTAIVPVSEDSAESAERGLKAALENAGIKKEDIANTVGTGYGDIEVPFANKMLPDMTCHAKGAFTVNPKVRTVIEIGGIDSKAFTVTDTGAVDKFSRNEKCAAGTGLFLEQIAEVLELKVEDLGRVSLEQTEELKITNQCSVFVLSEVISLVALKKTVPNIVAGIHAGVANRIISMVVRLSPEGEYMLSGGLAKNAGVCKELEDRLEIKLADSSTDPQLLCALGAAVLAQQ